MASDSSGELRRVMVDIETLGTEAGCAILSIGAVRFGAGKLGDTFHSSIHMRSCADAGLEIDAGTLEWWLEQDDDAKEVLTGGDELSKVLFKFTEWLDGADEIWANSPSFDCEILQSAYEAVGQPVPWSYYEERDYRTLRSLPVAPDVDQDGVEHDALDDAEHQAYVAAAALSSLEGIASPDTSDVQRGATGDD